MIYFNSVILKYNKEYDVTRYDEQWLLYDLPFIESNERQKFCSLILLLWPVYCTSCPMGSHVNG
jgi:hypothetical protein